MNSFPALALLFANNFPNKPNALALIRLRRPPGADCCCKITCRAGDKRLMAVRRQVMQQRAQQCVAQDKQGLAGAVQYLQSICRCSIRPPKPAAALRSAGRAA